MVQYEVIACSARCQGSSQQTQNSHFFFHSCTLTHWNCTDEHAKAALSIRTICLCLWCLFAFRSTCVCVYAVTATFNHICSMLCLPRQKKKKMQSMVTSLDFIITAPSRMYWFMCRTGINLAFWLTSLFFFVLHMNKIRHLNWLYIEHISPSSFPLSYSPQRTLFNKIAKTFPSHWQIRNRVFILGLNATYFPEQIKW